MRIKLLGLAKISGCRLGMITMAIALVLGGIVPLCWGKPSNRTESERPTASSPWQGSQILQPEALARTLSAAKGEKPLVICVGFPILYQGGHIVGARFAGPASRPAGLRKLKREVQDLPRNKSIVIYCGCCPWSRCPNIRPAFRAMQDWGFTNVQVLSIPTNFQKDWIAKGYPTRKGPEKQ